MGARETPKALLVGGLVALVTGCHGTQPYVTAQRLERGLVVVLPGIEGRSPLNEAICDGLNDGGVDWAIELRDWTSCWGPLVNLRSEQRNRRKAAEIANRIVRYQMAYPDRSVVLVGQSGGGAIAAWVAEAMPPPRPLDGVVMLAAALSRNFMLDQVLRNSTRGVVSFYSLEDWILIGTHLAGTMDGHLAPSAGRARFRVPSAGGRPKLYDKLFQIAWQPPMSQTGYSGGHLTSGARGFVATYVAPFILAGQWDSDLVARVLSRQPITAPAEGAETRPATRPAAGRP